MQQPKISRQHILDTALDIIEADGMKALTQPKLAKRTGIRQSLLTYYYPRKADLYVALLEASHRRAEEKGIAPTSLADMLASLFFEPERMRFFLAIVMEVGDDPELLPVLRGHAQGLCTEIARRIGRQSGDAQVASFVDELRGIGIRALMSPDMAVDREAVLLSVATSHGIDLSEAVLP